MCVCLSALLQVLAEVLSHLRKSSGRESVRKCAQQPCCVSRTVVGFSAVRLRRVGEVYGYSSPTLQYCEDLRREASSVERREKVVSREFERKGGGVCMPQSVREDIRASVGFNSLYSSNECTLW